MIIEIPDDTLHLTKMTKEELKIEIAILLFEATIYATVLLSGGE